MANASDADKKELIDKLTRHVAARFGGTGSAAWQKAFAQADRDKSGVIDALELGALLEDAGVGNFLTIDAWVSGVMGELNRDEDDGISYPELEAVLVRTPSTAAVFEQAPAANARPDYLYPLNMTPAKPVAAAKKPTKAQPAAGVPWVELAALGLLVLLLTRGKRG